MNAVLTAPGNWEIEHGSQCACLLLAAAVGAGPSAVNLSYCRFVLQKRWRVRCNHGGGIPATRATPELPPHDPTDAVQAILIANAILRGD